MLFLSATAQMVFRFLIIILNYWQDLSRLRDMSLSVNAGFIINAFFISKKETHFRLRNTTFLRTT